jgi:hypothetical protein
MTRNPVTALIVVICFDAYGSIRNIKKSWLFPNSEELTSWVIFSIAGLVGLFSIERFTFLESSYLIYLTTASFITTSIIYYRRKI